jgi:hypothetical protein
MNWFLDPLAQLAEAEAEWELRRDYGVVMGIQHQVNDIIDAGPPGWHRDRYVQDGSAAWLGPARRAFDGREAELQGMLRLAAIELEALAAELQAAIQGLRREP